MKDTIINAITFFHQKLIFQKRTKILATKIIQLINTDDKKLLDIGCGDGSISNIIRKNLKDIEISGVDTKTRDSPKIPVTEYNGRSLPFEDNSFDVLYLIDVLHHTENMETILLECSRVARNSIIIKDHYCENTIDRLKLSFMDWVGNRGFSVSLPYNYKSRHEWEKLFDKLNLEIEHEDSNILLYTQPLQYFFGNNLHFFKKISLKKSK